MKRSSGMLMLILVALLVILPVSAFGLDPDNGLYGLDMETKTIEREEVTELLLGENVTAFAVEPKPVEIELIQVVYYGIPNNRFGDEGGIPVSPGGLAGSP